MKIDRSMFLVLTGALAGGACHVYVDEPAKTAAGPQPAPPPQQPLAAPPPPPAPGQPGAPAHVIPMRLPGHGPISPAQPGVTPPPAPAPSPPPAPASCLDTGATVVPDCATMKAPDSSCAPFPFPLQKCAAYKAYFDAKVAAAAVACEVALTSKQVCDATQTYNCGKAALAQACPDPGVAQLCQIAASACKTSPGDCTTLISGLNAQGQQTVAQCVAQGCQAGLYSCVEGLTGPNTGGKH